LRRAFAHVENSFLSQGFSTDSAHLLWVFHILFHSLWKTVWKKEVLHSLFRESLWNSSKFSQNRDKSPFFAPARPAEGVDKLSTILWKNGKSHFSPQARLDKSAVYSTEFPADLSTTTDLSWP
jgi:hypothetical protein